MTKKGSAGIAEQGSIGELRGNVPLASSAEGVKAKSPGTAAKPDKAPQEATATPKGHSFRGQAWSELPDDPPESFSTAIPDTVPMAKA